MKGILLLGLLLLVLGGALLYFGIVGKVLEKMFTKKEKKN